MANKSSFFGGTFGKFLTIDNLIATLAALLMVSVSLLPGLTKNVYHTIFINEKNPYHTLLYNFTEKN